MEHCNVVLTGVDGVGCSVGVCVSVGAGAGAKLKSCSQLKMHPQSQLHPRLGAKKITPSLERYAHATLAHLQEF